ncbi:MAG: hypothetical protein L6R42_005754, partial [Xanthoria sp. 1 TBL-2021]
MSRQQTKLIDKYARTMPGKRQDMQVLALGLSRTGTMSLQAALNKLGYKCYHMAEVPNNKKKGHFWCWHEAMLSKFNGTGPKYTPADLAHLLEDYSAVTDIPCVLFSDELLTAFPHAKVILTNRDPDRWLQSIEKLYSIITWKSMNLLARFEPDIGKYLSILQMAITSWTYPGSDWQDRSQLRAGFLRHYQHVRASVPPDRLLEFRSEDGWGPLCAFLEKQVPADRYPFVNAGNELFHIHYALVAVTAMSLIVKGLLWVAPVGVVLFG